MSFSAGITASTPGTHLEFFSTTAQVIPIIVLTLAFEIRAKGDRDFWTALYVAPVYVVLFVAEAAALHVLVSAAPSTGWKWFVGVATTLGGVAVLMPLFLEELNVIIGKQNVDRAIKNIPRAAAVWVPFFTALFFVVYAVLK